MSEDTGRELLERALGHIIGQALFEIGIDDEDIVYDIEAIMDALAEQIVVECEVEHGEANLSKKTFITQHDPKPPHYWAVNIVGSGHHGKVGRGLIIIVPLPKVDNPGG